MSAHAQDCSDYLNGLLDGEAGTIAPSQLQIDRTCTIRNYPAGNELGTNFSFLTQPGQTDDRWVVIFDNVVHTGQMACNAVAGHKIWFTNGSSTSIQEGCQNLLIPVEKIDKQGPAAASIGVPFTYRLTLPVLFDPGTGTVINTEGSLNELHSITLIDDLNATGVDLTYVSHSVYWETSGTAVSHTFVNNGGVLTFDNFPIIPAGEQVILEITVVLEDSPVNSPGTQFINTAKWEFGRLIDGVFYEPLPGEWGISEPTTIGGPELVMTKSGPATLNLGDVGDFVLDIHNTGNSDAWDAQLVDRLPNAANGGMCDAPPVITSAQVFAADGTTAVPGKGPLTAGVDYDANFNDAPQCVLSFAALTAAAVIGADERLVIRYQSELDWNTANNITLTNVAGVTAWFNDDDGNPNRQGYARTVTNGTVGTPDHQDAHTLATVLTGYYFEKTVANRTTGVSPSSDAAPGDALRYTLRLRTTDSALNDFRFYDELGALNAQPSFVPGTLAIVPGTLPPGADAGNTNPAGGADGTGVLDIRSLSLGLDSELQIQFDATLADTLIDGSVVANQVQLISNGPVLLSDDPYLNGTADPEIDGDEDPTRVLIEAAPPVALGKGKHSGHRRDRGGVQLYRDGAVRAAHGTDLRRPHPRRPHCVGRGSRIRVRRAHRRYRYLDAREHRHCNEPGHRGSGQRHRHPGRTAGGRRNLRAADRYAGECRGPRVYQQRKLHLPPARRRSADSAHWRCRHLRPDDSRRAGTHRRQVRPAADAGGHSGDVHARCP